MKTKLFITIILLHVVFASKTLSQVNGQITVNKDFYDSMKVKFSNELLTKGLICEAWKVKYVVIDDIQNGTPVSVTRIYLQEKSSSMPVSLTPEELPDKVNLKFNISNLQPAENYALVYYLNSYPEKFLTVRFDKKGDDGSGRQNVKFETNVSSKIGAGRVFGIYSINSNSRNLDIKLFTHTQRLAFGLFGDIVDWLGDAAKALWNGLGCVVVDALGTIVTQIYGIVQSLVTDDGVVVPRYRQITDTEYNYANEKIFNGNLPAKDKILISNLLGFGKRQFTWPLACSGYILMNLGKVGYENALSAIPVQGQPTKPGEVFIHELTHVWQIHTSADIKFTLKSMKDQFKDLIGNSVYSYSCGSSWAGYNYEQQAAITQTCFNTRERGTANSCEEKYVVDNIRKGVPYISEQCKQNATEITNTRSQIQRRISQMKQEKLDETGESPVRNSDGTFKVGTQKGLGNISISQSQIDNDPEVKRLRAKLAGLQQTKATLGCP